MNGDSHKKPGSQRCKDSRSMKFTESDVQWTLLVTLQGLVSKFII